jgi:hypothetical protein
MASAFASKTTVVILLMFAGIANGQETQQTAPPSARATMVENANASAQSSTDVSYGGVPDTRSATGSKRSDSSPTCANGVQCDAPSKH